jgi:hypothetical protein
LLKDLPDADYLLADKGYGVDWFLQLPYGVDLYKGRHKIENMFSRLKDWHPIATLYDRCAHIFFSSVSIACSFLFYFEFCMNL